MKLRRDPRSEAGGICAELSRKGTCQNRGQKMRAVLSVKITLHNGIQMKPKSLGIEQLR